MVLSDYVFAVFHIDRSRNMEITARELYVRMTVYLWLVNKSETN